MTFPRLFVLSFVSLFTGGCLGSPSPLAPGLKGSVGIPHHGVLTESEELPVAGSGYRRFRERGTAYYGLPRLVTAITRVASELAAERPKGPPLIVGDLSGRRGGKVPRHNSHRSGRDVDFLFFVETPEGIPTDNPGFFPLDADGFVRVPDGRYFRLDVPRQWAFIKLLLNAPEIDVQFLFMSEALEAQLMNYALATEVDWDLLYRAESVMLQPADALPHADHIHMRIACRPEETINGCFGGGPAWPWYPKLPRLAAPEEELFAQLKESDPFTLTPLPLDESETSPPLETADTPIPPGPLPPKDQHAAGAPLGETTAKDAEESPHDG